MRRLIVLFIGVVLAPGVVAQNPVSISGEWLVTQNLYGNPLYQRLRLTMQNGKLTGVFDGDKLEGTVNGNAIHFVSRDEDNDTSEFTGVLNGATITGKVVGTDGSDPNEKTENEMMATRAPERPAGPPKRHEFTPTVFYRQFSASNAPVLKIAPGDTVHTTTVDAGGEDEHGVRRVLGGNPETGPFFIQTAWPGDTLVVHFNRIRLNRDYAVSDDAIVGRALDTDMAVKMKDGGKTVRWRLDRQRGVAATEKPGDHLKEFSVPLHPMLGCVATAPGFASAPPPTGDSGRFGGNMDFNEIVEGVTAYLPVNQPGALLYVGDGHAAQGDGELNGNALETLEQDYGLTPSEIAQVLGTSVQLNIGEVADRNAGVAAKLTKARLQPLTKKQ